MKKKYLLTTISLLYLVALQAQQIEKILEVPWNTENGIKTELHPAGNYGLSEFAMVSENEVAFLCDVEQKVKIYNLNNQELTYEFAYDHGNKNFTYDQENGLFYIIDWEYLYVHCKDGSLNRKIEYNNVELPTFKELKALDNHVYITSNQVTYPVVRYGEPVDPTEQIANAIDGRILNDGYYANNPGFSKGYNTSFQITKNGITTDYTIDLSKNSSGISPLGVLEDYIVLIEYYTKDGEPYNYLNYLLIYSKSRQRIINKVNIPKIHYTFVSNKFKVANNKVYHLITTPDNALLFKISFSNLKSTVPEKSQYPDYLDYEFHYNRDLQY